MCLREWEINLNYVNSFNKTLRPQVKNQRTTKDGIVYDYQLTFEEVDLNAVANFHEAEIEKFVCDNT